MPRSVRLVLCTAAGHRLGALPRFDVATPWWPDVEPVVAGARERHGVEVLVLRLLDAGNPGTVMGGPVDYLAEVVAGPPATRPPPLEPAPADLPDDPLRAHWARPGGVTAIVDWADGALAAIGRPRTGPAEQVKTWNLSCVLRLPTVAGPVWCKSVPPFFAHEGPVIAAVGERAPALVPPLLAADPRTGTVLLDDVAGEDQRAAPPERLIEMVRRLVALQADWAGRVPHLLDLGLPDWRAGAFPAMVEAMLRRPQVRADLGPTDATAVGRLAGELPHRLSELAACGLPETLVHGDFHPGNWRSDGTSLVLLDWGDSGVGHPLLDTPAFLDRVPEPVRARVAAAWADAWRGAVPDADPVRAAELVAPVAALRQALIYQTFLDGIEASERRYHDADVADWLRRAIATG